MMPKPLQSLFSFPLMITLISLLAIVCAIATFIENDYGTQSAKALVYSAIWFQALLALLAVNLTGVIIRFKMWRREKLPMFLFHSAFVIIILGAAITKFFGYEGLMHIREGKETNRMISAEPYLQFTILKGAQIGGNMNVPKHHFLFQHYFSGTPYGSNDFTHTMALEGVELVARYVGFKPSDAQGEFDELLLELEYGGEKSQVRLLGGMGRKGMEERLQLGDLLIKAEFGSKVLHLPFSVHLREFELQRYPGSQMPSSYASEVTVIPKEGAPFEYRIFMNHVLDFGGFRFFQSSYDPDERGTVLSANNDPGKWPTYLGYFLLSLGLILAFFVGDTRFGKLSRYASTHRLGGLGGLALMLLALSQTPLQAATPEETAAFLNRYAQHTEAHAKLFGALLVQDNGGRVKPIDSLAHEILLKVSRKEQFYGMNPVQVLMGMAFYPEEFQKLKMVKLSTPALKEFFGLKGGESHIAWVDAFAGENREIYRLQAHVNEAHRKKPAQQGTLDKDAIRVDERINILYMAYHGSFFRMFPKPDDPNHTWVSPMVALGEFSPEGKEQVRTLLARYLDGFHQGVEHNRWEEANDALEAIKAHQRALGAAILPDSSRIEAEILSNHLKLFERLSSLYIIAGVLLFLASLVAILSPGRSIHIPRLTLHGVITLGAVLHTLGLGLRAYISGHAPWSDAYESMLYIAWAGAVAGALFFRRSPLALSAAAMLSGITLFVAHLGFMDPQITNLVPVLKSYWLNIHVSVITASYGFLALGALLGLLTLGLFIFRQSKRSVLDDSIWHLSAINEMSLMIGLALLTIGNFLGGVWANESWGRYWGWDPKETWSLISILVYTVVLHLRFIPKMNTPYLFAISSSVAFASILMTYFGVNFYLSGMHSYASGDPVPIPAFVYWMSACVAALITLAWFRRDLGPIPLKDSRSS